MDQNIAAPGGWQDFARQYWLQKPYNGEFFSPPPFDAGALWEVALRAGPESHFSRPDGPVALDERRYFPRAEDGGFDGYADRLARELPDGGFFQQNQLQSVDVAIYDWAREFLWGLFDAVGGMPPARAWLDTMFGHYPTTPVGIHHGEPGGVFMFVLDGRKQLLLWPPDTEGIKQDTLSYDEACAVAQVQDGTDGSMCYWPGHWWHVGESPTGPSLSLHVTVHLLRGEEIGWDALEDIDSGYSIDQHLPPTGASAHQFASEGHDRLVSQLNSPQARQKAIEAHMCRLSSVCLQKAPPAAPRRRLEPDEVVVVDPRFPILVAETAPGRMSCAANGYMFRIDSSERFSRLVERLNTGEPAEIRTLCTEFAASHAGTDPLDKNTLLGVLERLVAGRALRPMGDAAQQRPESADQQSA